MAALPPLHARARRLLLAAVAAAATGTGLGYLVAIWPAPEPFRDPFRHDPAVYAVYATAPALQRDPRCVLFLDEWMRRPNWELTIARGRSDVCGGDGGGSRYRGREHVMVTSDGGATYWTRDGERRSIFVPPTLLARLHEAATTTCTVAAGTEDDRFVRLHWGGTTATPGPLVLAGSHAFDELDAFVDAARDLGD